MTNTSSRRRRTRRLPPEARVESIMEAARATFRERGYVDATTAEIAERAGVVEGSIYRFFKTKRDLLVRVVEDWYADILQGYDQQLKGVHGTRNRLRFMISHHLEVIHSDPAMCRLIFGELRPAAEYRNTSVFALNRAYTQRTLKIIEDGIKTGELRADVPLSIARDMIYGAVEHHTFAFLRGEADFPADDAADAIADLIYRGLARAADGESSIAENALRRLEKVARRLEKLSKND